MLRKAVARGFTLIELLVVLTIIGVLIALLLPAVQAAREAARRVHCTNNLKQIALAVHGYLGVNDVFPTQIGHLPRTGAPSDYRVSWLVQILSQLEKQPLFDAYNFFNGPGPSTAPDVPAFSPRNRTVIETKVDTFLCPSYSGPAALQGQADFVKPNDVWWVAGTCYKGNLGDNTTIRFPGFDMVFGDVLNGQPTARGMLWRGTMVVTVAGVRDGLALTMLAGEALPDACKLNSWANSNHSVAVSTIPLNQNINNDPINWMYCIGFKSRHRGGSNFAFADGSVRFLKESIAPATYRALSSRAGGEAIDGSSF